MIGLNNKKIGFIVDSSSDISNGQFEDVKVVPLGITVTENGIAKTYKDGVDINLFQLKDELKAGKDIKTSQANMMDMMKAADEMCSQYDYVVVLPIHAKLSSNYNSWKIIQEDYPNLVVVMSLDITRSFVWTIDLLKDYLTSHECNEAQLQDYVNKEVVPHRFGFLMVTDLKQLVKGGRVSGLKAAIAKLFKINPVIFMDNNGLANYDRARSYEQYFKIVDAYMAEHRQGQSIKKIFIVTPIGNEQVGKDFVEAFNKHYNNMPHETTFLPTVVVAHTGVDHVAMYFDVR